MCVPGAVLKLLINDDGFSVDLSDFYGYDLGDRTGLLSDFIY
jgi:hypothetical protein